MTEPQNAVDSTDSGLSEVQGPAEQDAAAPDAAEQEAAVQEADARPRRRAPRWLKAVGGVILWIVIIVSMTAIAALVLVPRIAGATPYTILTGSMQPDMPPGTIIVVKPTPFDEIQQGDVITYQIESGKPMVVTHRVVGIDVVNGETRLVTQGDANDAPDLVSVREVQVKGVVWYHVPFIGYATTLVDDATKGIAVRVLGGLLLGYAVFATANVLFRRKKHTP